MVTIIPRSAVGLPAEPAGTSMPTPVARLVLHHQAGSDYGRSTWRYIYGLHTDPDGRDWWDIGYQWGYSPRTREFYEGRGPGVRGAHVAGLNYGSHGLCVLGDYDRDNVPEYAIDDLAAFARWHGEQGHGPGEFTHGHRDLGRTSCPGANLDPLIPDINARAGENEDEMRLTELVQQAVADAGFDPGPVDGEPGPRTQAALTEALKGSPLSTEGARFLEETYRELKAVDARPTSLKWALEWLRGFREVMSRP